MGDLITHSCSRVKETDLLMSTSTDRDNPLILQAPCWNLPHLHVLSLMPHPPPGLEDSEEYIIVAGLRHRHRRYLLLQTFQFLLGLWADFLAVCSVWETKARAAAPAVDGLHRCWFPQVAILQRTCFFPYGTWGPWMVSAWIASEDPHFLTAPDSAFVQSCLFCVGEISYQNWNFVELFLFLLYQGKNQFIINSFFTCWNPSHW